tara:strand:+ start:209 stop:931 length:723 start_codon:yes stop_codon:yes gene_type:complete
MKKTFLAIIIVFTSSVLVAQSTDTVMVGNMYYSPSSLTIESGDQVVFVLVDGVHDVNFETSSLTGVSFDNPSQVESIPMQSLVGLMGAITFDAPGVYDYDCSGYGHAGQGMVGYVTVLESSDCIDDDQAMNTIFSGGMSISTCTEAIEYLVQNYSWTENEACELEVDTMFTFSGTTLADFCECSCGNQNINIIEISPSNQNGNYLYSIDLFGRKVDFLLKNQIIFDVYSSGKVLQRMIIE